MRNRRRMNPMYLLCSFAMILGVSIEVALAQTPITPPGLGGYNDPYQISQVGHLLWMSKQVSSARQYYRLTADIDASETATWNDEGTSTDLIEGFPPIGASSGFRGIFDGEGHTITGLVINRPHEYYIGLFRSLAGGLVKNVALIGGSVRGADEVGALAGSNTVAIQNCYAAVEVYGTSGIGGLIGYNDSTGTVSNCCAAGAVVGTSSLIGGLVGCNRGTISYCYAAGSVSFSSASVQHDSPSGLIGYSYSTNVVSSYWDIQSTGCTSSSGGIGKSTEEMKQQATFADWDLTETWQISEGDSYPYLQMFPPPMKLHVRIVGPGSVTIDPSSPDGTYAPGTVVTVTTNPPEEDAVFSRWGGTTPNESTTATVVMDTHRALTAVFLPRIEINSLADLTKIGNDPDFPYSDVFYVLTTDIDASETATWNDEGTSTDLLEGFKPIGNYSDPYAESFRTIFDGNGHTIEGLVINRPSTDYVGLFGYIRLGAHIRNLGLIGGTIIGSRFVGGIAGSNGYCGIISNCYTSCSVAGGYVGGLVGYHNRSTLFDCYTTGVVTGGVRGGLVGRTDSAVIARCYATGYGSCLFCSGSWVDPAVACYFDIETTGCTSTLGGTGKSTAEMKQQATFVGWDFENVWGIHENLSYPYLRILPDTRPPTCRSAVSRKPHGATGDCDVIVSTPGAVEGRQGGPTSIVVDFNEPIYAVTGTPDDVTVSSGTIENLSMRDRKLTVQLSGVQNRQDLQIGFPGIRDGMGNTVQDTLCLGVLLGDISCLNGDNTDGKVNLYDLLKIKSMIDQPVDLTNYRCDVASVGNGEPDGLINIYDLIAVKDHFDQSLADSCP